MTLTGISRGGDGVSSGTAGTAASDGGAGVTFNGDNGSGGTPALATTLLNSGNILGGDAGAGTNGDTVFGSAGGVGGNGGAGIFDDANFTVITNNHLIKGGAGGNGGAGGAGASLTSTAGGNAGNGGNGITSSGTNATIEADYNIEAGAGGNGGDGVGAGAGGNGGNGGNAVATEGNSNAAITVNTVVFGGDGGSGGNAPGAGAGGAGGNGGDGVSLGGMNSSLTVGSSGDVVAGIGAIGGNSGSGTGGNGGNGGSGISTSSSGAVILIDQGGQVDTEATNSGGTGATAGAAGANGNAVQFRTGTTGATLTNHGYIGYIDGVGGVALLGNAAVTSITNETDGGIEGDNAAGLSIGSGTTLTTLVNLGTIDGVDNGAGLSINGTGTLGTLTNAVTAGLYSPLYGVIRSYSTSGDAYAALVLNSTSQGALSNASIIENLSGGVALAFTANTPGTFTNAAGGLIKATTTTGGMTPVITNHTAIDFAANGTVINNGTVTGNITNTAGIANFTNSGTVTGDITLSGPFLAAGPSLTITAGTITGNVSLTGFFGTTLNLDGGQIVGNTGYVSGVNNSAINVGGDYTTGGIFNFGFGSSADLDVTAGTFNIQNDVDLGPAGTITNAGTIRLGAGSTLTSATQNAGGAYVFDVASDSSYGQLTLTGGAVTLTNANTSVNVIGSPVLTPGGLLQIASGTAAAVVTNGTVTDNSALYNFRLESGATAGQNADDAYLLVSALSGSSAAAAGLNGNEQNVFAALNGTTSSDPDFTAVRTNVQNASSNREAAHDLEKAEPSTDGGAFQAAVDAAETLFNLADQQLASLRADDASTGMAAGNRGDGIRSWGQFFGGHAGQGDRNGNAGYSANTGGGAVGADTQSLFDDSVLGLSFAYGHTHVSSSIDNTTQVNSYQATVYGSHYLASIDKGLFIDGMAAFQYGRNDETRNDVGGVDGLDATGRYNAYEGAGRVDLGRDFRVPALHGATLTPTLLSDYAIYHQETTTKAEPAEPIYMSAATLKMSGMSALAARRLGYSKTTMALTLSRTSAPATNTTC